jgi:hypothetical protein
MRWNHNRIVKPTQSLVSIHQDDVKKSHRHRRSTRHENSPDRFCIPRKRCQLNEQRRTKTNKDEQRRTNMAPNEAAEVSCHLKRTKVVHDSESHDCYVSLPVLYSYQDYRYSYRYPAGSLSSSAGCRTSRN